jgi:hypothetical protein
MVKSIFNYTLYAKDVVDQRTVSVSKKPHLGAELFPLYESRPDVFPDLENWSFERSIYNRLHGLQLRDSDASASKLHVLERHWNLDSGREIALDLHRELAKNALNPQRLLSDLSAIVLPLSRSCLLEKLHKAMNQAKMGRTSHNSNNANADNGHFVPSSSDAAADFTSYGFHDLRNPAKLYGDLSVEALILIQHPNGNQVKGEAKPWSLSDRDSLPCATAKWANSLAQRKHALCPSSAPLWFLQSMATGPPAMYSSR